MYRIHMPADHTAIIQLNVTREWASNFGHSSWDPDKRGRGEVFSVNEIFSVEAP